MKELLQEVKTISEIITTGHSLGGALAVLCAYDLSEEFKNKSSDLYSSRLLEKTFQPRACFKCFKGDDLNILGKVI